MYTLRRNFIYIAHFCLFRELNQTLNTLLFQLLQCEDLILFLRHFLFLLLEIEYLWVLAAQNTTEDNVSGSIL